MTVPGRSRAGKQADRRDKLNGGGIRLSDRVQPWGCGNSGTGWGRATPGMDSLSKEKKTDVVKVSITPGEKIFSKLSAGPEDWLGR